MSTSLAVRQFVGLIRGEAVVHALSNPFRVEAVRAAEGYCLRCCGMRTFDVATGLAGEVLRICRVCGAGVFRPTPKEGSTGAVNDCTTHVQS